MKQSALTLLILACLYIFMVACGGEKSSASDSAPTPEGSEATSQEESGTEEESTASAEPSNRRGQLIFKQYCVICHGADGKLGVSGAKDLSVSTISFEERLDQITNGKGLMTPYKGILSEEQILAVAKYLDELKQ